MNTKTRQLTLTKNTWGDIISEDLFHLYCHFRMTLHLVISRNELKGLIKNLKKGIDFNEKNDIVDTFDDDYVSIDVETFSLEKNYKEYEINIFPAKIKPILINKEAKELLLCLEEIRRKW